MDNQHKLIAGYRDLSEGEIAKMNAVKLLGVEIGRMIEDMRAMPDLDQRWVSIAQTNFQTGLMAAVRAIAQPTSF